MSRWLSGLFRRTPDADDAPGRQPEPEEPSEPEEPGHEPAVDELPPPEPDEGLSPDRLDRALSRLRAAIPEPAPASENQSAQDEDEP